MTADKGVKQAVKDAVSRLPGGEWLVKQRQGSLQLLAISSDQIGFLRAANAGVAVNDETLALDVIDELGPTGSYLAHPHTMKHMKEPYYSGLADKNPYAVWAKRGATTMEARAGKLVDEILAQHVVEPLPAEVQQGIKKIVEREQAWINARE